MAKHNISEVVKYIEVPKIVEIPKFITYSEALNSGALQGESAYTFEGWSKQTTHECGVGDEEVNPGLKEDERLKSMAGEWVPLPEGRYLMVDQLVEVKEAFTSDNAEHKVVLNAGLRGLIKKIDSDGDIQV